jgi:FkbM family methyltransferase
MDHVRLFTWNRFQRHAANACFTISWYDDLQVGIYFRSEVNRCLYVRGAYKPNEFVFLSEMLSPGMVVIDVGANEGLYSLFAGKRVGPTGKVLAIEPSLREFARLTRNITMNRSTNVIPLRYAAYDRNGIGELHIAGFGHEGRNSLGCLAHDTTAIGTERVPLATLDEICEGHSLMRVDVVKIDTEGAEFAILRGAVRLLSRFRPLLLLSIAETALVRHGASRGDLISLLAGLDYRFWTFGTAGTPESGFGLEGVRDNMIAIHMHSELTGGQPQMNW